MRRPMRPAPVCRRKPMHSRTVEPPPPRDLRLRPPTTMRRSGQVADGRLYRSTCNRNLVADAFIKAGDKVKAGQTLLIIEAMRDDEPDHGAARRRGARLVLVADAQPVEFGEPLVVLEVGAGFRCSTKVHIANLAARSRSAFTGPARRWASPPSPCTPRPTPSAMHVRLADRKRLHPVLRRRRRAYLNIPSIITAGVRDHRGQGDPSQLRLPQLRTRASRRSSNAHGLTFIGPKPEHIRIMGDKISAKQTAHIEAGHSGGAGLRRRRKPRDR